MMIIPFLDLKKLQEEHKKEILEEIEKVTAWEKLPYWKESAEGYREDVDQ